ncbi:hypothetical protein JN535_08530 [Cellulosimicrobium cellulans]|uniref:hypothetical protein n=1 Tax=Cellulosimicrobium cellulans TaxID=1710 RepID=UPI00196499E7|nr:hypothetical protein [Cellulosimicrobium cellulans]MBN0040211.1 hypothetical protein [Cellulosimicrobium cellulans]
MSIHEQARAEAEKRFPDTWKRALQQNPPDRDRDIYVGGFLAGHEAATRTRVVTTVTELDALAVGSVVLDAHDNPWGHPRDGLASWVDLEANEDALLWWSATRIDLPARVLYDPEEGR